MTVVANPGFEDPLAGESGVVPVPITVGNWLAFKLPNAPVYPSRVESPVHAGDYAGRVTSSAGASRGNYFLQDFPPEVITPDAGFELSAWVRPVAGSQQLSLFTDWDRAVGTVGGTHALAIGPTATTIAAWGESVESPVVVPRDGEWHHVLLRGRPSLTSEFLLDGVIVDSIETPGSFETFDVATVLVGQGGGDPPVDDDFCWDEVALTFSVRDFVVGCVSL